MCCIVVIEAGRITILYASSAAVDVKARLKDFTWSAKTLCNAGKPV